MVSLAGWKSCSYLLPSVQNAYCGFNRFNQLTRLDQFVSLGKIEMDLAILVHVIYVTPDQTIGGIDSFAGQQLCFLRRTTFMRKRLAPVAGTKIQSLCGGKQFNCQGAAGVLQDCSGFSCRDHAHGNMVFLVGVGWNGIDGSRMSQDFVLGNERCGCVLSDHES